MKCPTCGGKLTVRNVRPTPYGIRRRRLCSACNLRFTTLELYADSPEIQALRELVALCAKNAELQVIYSSLETRLSLLRPLRPHDDVKATMLGKRREKHTQIYAACSECNQVKYIIARGKCWACYRRELRHRHEVDTST